MKAAGVHNTVICKQDKQIGTKEKRDNTCGETMHEGLVGEENNEVGLRRKIANMGTGGVTKGRVDNVEESTTFDEDSDGENAHFETSESAIEEQTPKVLDKMLEPTSDMHGGGTTKPSYDQVVVEISVWLFVKSGYFEVSI
ncbi:hypothetical protein K2173_007796 [Erythroxylum novogranatense]|uniref:Uncharacterized protein n=1 Tax=Erythroxylum novogranatense TaxID=1862640 RepID=A0AAV8TCV8_9ROSI|nr:hypothetical protein K2173_007796 [Erythroxylum novogranatense]